MSSHKTLSGLLSRIAIALPMVSVPGIVYQGKQQQQNRTSVESTTTADDLSTSSPRIKLSDGRYLAYRETGVPKSEAKHKIILLHGFGSSKEMNFLAPQELIDELKIYFLLFDRAGYGESDPNPKRSVKSEASDIQELADQLHLGSKFYVIGVSMGTYAAWGCLNFIPDRLAGLALVVPVINYKWQSLPGKVVRDDYRRGIIKWSLWLASHAPGLLHWYVTQKWVPSTSMLEKNPVFFNQNDLDVLKRIPGFPMLTQDRLQDRSVFDTLCSDFKAAYGDWEFDPLEITEPSPNDKSHVHIWQGCEDKVIPVQLQRCVSRKLPWIQYHEVKEGGHLIVHYDGLSEAILRALLLGEEPLTYKPSTDTNSS